jgi:hypothetical protein
MFLHICSAREGQFGKVALAANDEEATWDLNYTLYFHSGREHTKVWPFRRRCEFFAPPWSQGCKNWGPVGKKRCRGIMAKCHTLACWPDEQRIKLPVLIPVRTTALFKLLLLSSAAGFEFVNSFRTLFRAKS